MTPLLYKTINYSCPVCLSKRGQTPTRRSLRRRSNRAYCFIRGSRAAMKMYITPSDALSEMVMRARVMTLSQNSYMCGGEESISPPIRGEWEFPAETHIYTTGENSSYVGMKIPGVAQAGVCTFKKLVCAPRASATLHIYLLFGPTREEVSPPSPFSPLSLSLSYFLFPLRRRYFLSAQLLSPQRASTSSDVSFFLARSCARAREKRGSCSWLQHCVNVCLYIIQVMYMSARNCFVFHLRTISQPRSEFSILI